MTEEQEKAIENLEGLLKQRYEKQVQITTYDLFGNIETVLNMLKEKDKEIEKKDKIIDLMANSFAEEGFYSEHCQTLIDNEVCPDDCNKCVKQYFERKSEE